MSSSNQSPLPTVFYTCRFYLMHGFGLLISFKCYNYDSAECVVFKATALES